MALATGGVKNRSRNEVAISRGRLFGTPGSILADGGPRDLRQKLETTAVKTSLMVAGLLAS